MSNPWIKLGGEGNTEYRLFAKYEQKDLYWHHDKEDRVVRCIHGECQLQLDNELPRTMYPGESYFIPKEEMHRIIADGQPFILEINFK